MFTVLLAVFIMGADSCEASTGAQASDSPLVSAVRLLEQCGHDVECFNVVTEPRAESRSAVRLIPRQHCPEAYAVTFDKDTPGWLRWQINDEARLTPWQYRALDAAYALRVPGWQDNLDFFHQAIERQGGDPNDPLLEAHHAVLEGFDLTTLSVEVYEDNQHLVIRMEPRYYKRRPSKVAGAPEEGFTFQVLEEAAPIVLNKQTLIRVLPRETVP